jgi:Flp pilus assembly protein TadD
MDRQTEQRGIEALYAVGHWLLERGMVRDAAAILRSMVQLSPTDERGWLALGVCHEQAEQDDVALEMFGTGAALCAPSARCELARARLLRARGEDDATEAYERAADAAEHDDELRVLIERERGGS